MVDGHLRAVCGVRVRIRFRADAASRRRALGRGHGRAGVDTQSSRHEHGAESQPRDRLRSVRVLLRRVLVPRQLAHGRAVRYQHPGEDRRFGHCAARGDPALPRLFKADEERRMRRSQ